MARVHQPFSRCPHRPPARCSALVTPTTDGGTIIGSDEDLLGSDDLAAWHILRPVLDDGPYLPWSPGALRPAALVIVCNEVIRRPTTHVVECGSGSSTVVLARLLRQQDAGGTVTALEHDANWVELVSTMLKRESLDAVARVLHAPLEGDPTWYARAAVAATPDVIDLLVVDGPPAYEAGLGRRREPALAAFDDRLARDATVVLDDVDRPGEQAVLAAWQAQHDWTFVVHDRAGAAVGCRR